MKWIGEAKPKNGRVIGGDKVSMTPALAARRPGTTPVGVFASLAATIATIVFHLFFERSPCQ
jgi:hypothetical protein